MKVPEKARHYGYTKQLAEPFDPKDGFAVQFEAAQTEGLDCGGAYLKYLTEDANTGFILLVITYERGWLSCVLSRSIGLMNSVSGISSWEKDRA